MLAPEALRNETLLAFVIRVRRRLFLVLLLFPLLTWRFNRSGFSDGEGMFAEPVREVIVTGDWVTPRVNGKLFLTNSVDRLFML